MNDDLNLGSCCACERTGPAVRNIIALNRPGPTPGKGWGCFQCRLPMAGAMAVLCDDCLIHKRKIRFVCTGYLAKDGRTPIEELPPGKFKHNMEYHPEALNRLVWFDDSPDFGHPDCLCSVCGDPIPDPFEGEGYDPSIVVPLRLLKDADAEYPSGLEARFCTDCVVLAWKYLLKPEQSVVHPFAPDQPGQE